MTVIDIDIATLDTIVEDPAITTTKPSKKSFLPVVFRSNLTIYYENGIIMPSLRNPYMKITKSKLKQIIKEELQSIMESRGRYSTPGYGGTDGDTGDPRYIRQRDYSEPTGRSKPSSSRKIPELPPEEKADAKLLDDASLFARMLLGNGYSVSLFDRSWRGSSDDDALLDAIRYIKNIDRSGDWNEIKAKAEEVIKRVSNEFIDRIDSDKKFRDTIARSYNAEYMKKIAGKIAAGLQSTY